jgi:hypothetical protein
MVSQRGIPMGRKSITGGVAPAGPARIQFDFYIDRVRFRPTIRWIPNEANLRRARAYLARIKAQIAAGTFCFADEFPDYQHLHEVRVPLSARTCGEVFDAFLRHDEARLARGDLAAPPSLRIGRSSITTGGRTSGSCLSWAYPTRCW